MRGQGIGAVALGAAVLLVWRAPPAQTVPDNGTLLFPQIASGQGFVAELILKNHSDVAAAGSIVLRQGTGQPLTLTLDGVLADTFAFELAPRGVKRFLSSAEGQVQAGYALIQTETAGARISGSVVYRFGGSEVSVAPAAPAAGYAGFVEQFSSAEPSPDGDQTVRTGIALVNPEADPVTLQVALLGGGGVLADSRELKLAAGEHRAMFVDEFFTDFFAPGSGNESSFTGSVELTAESGRFAMTILRMRFPSGRIASLGGVPIDPVFAIVGVTVAPMTGELQLSDQTVVVRGDRIAAIGPRSEIVVPGDAVIIDGQGRYLMPGLADMHVHLSFTAEFLLYVANGVTTVREMWGSTGHVGVRDEIADGLWSAAPTMLVAGPGFDDNPTTWPGTIVLSTAEQADAQVGAYQQAGYDFIKMYNNLAPGPFSSLMAAADKHGMSVIGHVPWKVGPAATMTAGPASLEHFLGFTPLVALPNWWSAGLTDPVIEAMSAALIGGGDIWHCPTLVTNEVMFTLAERQTFLDTTPEIRFLPPGLVQSWRDSPLFNTPAQRDTIQSNKKRLLKALHGAGGRLLVGTDGGFVAVLPGFTIHDELRIFQSAGLSPYEALRSATWEPAAFANQLDEFGTVQRGRRADLILLNSDPFEDVANVADRAGVMVRGRWLPEQELQRRLEEQAAGFASSFRAGPASRKIGSGPFHRH